MNDINRIAKNAERDAGTGCIILLALPIVILILAFIATILLD